jgi:hypothetical protein
MFSAALITREHIVIQSLSPTDPPQAPANAQVRSRPRTVRVNRVVNRVNLIFDRLWLAAPRAVAPRDAFHGRKDPLTLHAAMTCATR